MHQGSHPLDSGLNAVSLHRSAENANSYDALRLLLAVAVLISHTFIIGGYGTEPFLVWSKSQGTLGDLALLGFFGLSGFLVTASYLRSGSLIGYFTKRVRRIVPGLWVCLAVTALVLAPASFILRHGSLASFAWIDGEESALRFIVANLAIQVRQWTVSGVLDGAPYTESFNGSLWSLWPETLCYVTLAALGLAGLLERGRALFLVGLGALFTLHAAHTLLPGVTFPTLPTWVVLTDQARFFLAYLIGTALWLWRDRYEANWPLAILLIFISVALARLGGLRLLAPVVIPLALVVLGRCQALRLRHDLSYGLYIYGFPVQQLLTATPLRQYPWPAFFAVSLALALVFAALSWRLVEQPFLRRQGAPA